MALLYTNSKAETLKSLKREYNTGCNDRGRANGGQIFRLPLLLLFCYNHPVLNDDMLISMYSVPTIRHQNLKLNLGHSSIYKSQSHLTAQQSTQTSHYSTC
jgi:hypothetical protein